MDLTELTDEELELLEAEEARLAAEERLAMLEELEAIGNSLAKKREAAKNARKNSGIEEEWANAEDAYEGIDAADPGHYARSLNP
jgi:hypothetical protein